MLYLAAAIGGPSHPPRPASPSWPYLNSALSLCINCAHRRLMAAAPPGCGRLELGPAPAGSKEPPPASWALVGAGIEERPPAAAVVLGLPPSSLCPSISRQTWLSLPWCWGLGWPSSLPLVPVTKSGKWSCYYYTSRRSSRDILLAYGVLGRAGGRLWG
jgi:hypothetical protein